MIKKVKVLGVLLTLFSTPNLANDNFVIADYTIFPEKGSVVNSHFSVEISYNIEYLFSAEQIKNAVETGYFDFEITDVPKPFLSQGNQRYEATSFSFLSYDWNKIIVNFENIPDGVYELNIPDATFYEFIGNNFDDFTYRPIKGFSTQYAVLANGATGLQQVNKALVGKTGKVYNLLGQEVKTIGKGFYIINGEKIFIR